MSIRVSRATLGLSWCRVDYLDGQGHLGAALVPCCLSGWPGPSWGCLGDMFTFVLVVVHITLLSLTMAGPEIRWSLPKPCVPLVRTMANSCRATRAMSLGVGDIALSRPHGKYSWTA